MVHGREPMERREQKYIAPTKRTPLNCCNSPAARRVSKNADSICEQSNRETYETQEKLFSEF